MKALSSNGLIPTAVLLLTLPLLAAACGVGSPQEKAERIHREATVVDLHSDLIQHVYRHGTNFRSDDRTMSDLLDLRAGGVDAQFMAVAAAPMFEGTPGVKRTIELIDRLLREIEANSDIAGLALTVDDILRLNRQGKTALVMAVEGGMVIDDNLSILRTYHRLGARYMTLTWARNINWADASTDPPRHNGLTDLGREVVREMNRLGMMVDISHVSDQTFYDALVTSLAPIIASHSCCRAICGHPRNLSNDMLRALATNGGVVHINYYSEYISEDFRLKLAEMGQGGLQDTRSQVDSLLALHGGDLDKVDLIMAGEPGGRWLEVPAPPPLSAVIDHIDHVAMLVGVDYVGLGSDWDGISSCPLELNSAARAGVVTRELLKRDYSEEDIKKILGGNTLRVMRRVEAVADSLRRI